MNRSKARIGVFVCRCGENIAKTVDVGQVVDHVKKLEYVVLANEYNFMCSDPGQELIQRSIREEKLKSRCCSILLTIDA